MHTKRPAHSNEEKRSLQDKGSSTKQEVKLQKALLEIENNLLESHKEQRKKEAQAVKNIKDNSKYFFLYANKKSKNISAVGPLENMDGGHECDSVEMANILKAQY